jgi:DNA-binding NtrC family response regulator
MTSPDNGKNVILIVDDNDMMIQALDAILSEEFTLVLARNGEESIKKIREDGMISCVLMDLRLPDMNGVEAARAIKKIKPELPIIFHTGHSGDQIEESLVKEENVFGYLSKGDSITGLIETIRAACKSYQQKNHPDEIAD